MTQSQSAQQKRQEWAERIRRQQISGLTQRSWCSQEGVKFDRFQYWKKQLKRTAPGINHSNTVDQSAKPQATWIEMPQPIMPNLSARTTGAQESQP